MNFESSYFIVGLWCLNRHSSNGRRYLVDELRIQAVTVLVENRFPVIRLWVDNSWLCW